MKEKTLRVDVELAGLLAFNSTRLSCLSPLHGSEAPENVPVRVFYERQSVCAAVAAAAQEQSKWAQAELNEEPR
jgi:hypothetical protein